MWKEILILWDVPWSGDRETVRNESFNTVELFLYAWTFTRESETGNFSLWLFGDGYTYVEWKNWILSSSCQFYIKKRTSIKEDKQAFLKCCWASEGVYKTENFWQAFSEEWSVLLFKRNIRWLKVISKDKKKFATINFWSNWNLSQWVTRLQMRKKSKRSM